MAKNEAVINSFSALAGKGTPTVSGSDHARQLLSTATDQASYAAKIRALTEAAAGANASTGAAQSAQRARITGSPAASSSVIPADIQAIMAKHGVGLN